MPSTPRLIGTGAISAIAVSAVAGAPAEAAPVAESVDTQAMPTLDLATAPITAALPTAAAAPVVLLTVTPAAPVAAAAQDREHVVQRGDTVWDLAKRYGTTVSAIADANGLGPNALIRIGDRLTIPGAGAASAVKAAAPSPSAAATASHTVKPGDTVWDIARKHGTTVAAIVAANGLGPNAVIHVGDALTVPGSKAGAATSAAATAKAPTATASATYVVAAGDTLSRIATRFGTTVSTIAKANGIDNPSLIRVGQRLTIPGGVPTGAAASGLVGSTFAGRTYPADVVAAANQAKAQLLATDVPSRTQMRALVVATAKQWGVDPALAQAVAYQESGFDMRAVSPANAVGVMQVIPSTGEWMSTVVGRPLDLLDPEDNVTAGVALLAYLTKRAPSLDIAIAGYYQGLGGVMKYGMAKDTKQYVASVKALMAKFS